MDYHPLIRYRVVASDDTVFEGYIFAKGDALWIYRNSVIDGELPPDAVRVIYKREMSRDDPFSNNEVRGTGHLATVFQPASVTPLGPPMTVDELIATLVSDRSRW